MTIESLSHEGRGVARIDGKVVFVDGALPGERVVATRVKRRRSHDEARTEAVIEASPDRVEPRCPHFGVCGGCVLQHLDPDRQRAYKQGWLLDNLERIGGVVPDRVLPPIAGPAWHYRRRARLGARDVPGKGRVLVGFRERFKPYVTDMRRCDVLAGSTGRLIEPLSDLIGSLSIRRDVPQIEVAIADDATALVLRTLGDIDAEDRTRLRAFARDHSIAFYLQPGGMTTVAPLDPPAPALLYRVDGGAVTLAFEPTDFLQVNAAVNDALVGRVLDLLQPSADDRVLELFCGLGNFTLPIARRADSVVAVEGDPGLIDRARANAAANEIGNARFFTADLFEEPLTGAWLDARYDAVFLDPPRSGAGPVAGRCRALGASRIVYVSCHPATLARDAAILAADGYRLVAAGIADMFPHTAHVESIALFEADATGRAP